MANVISVSALNQYVKTVLESDIVLTDVAISGEISNFVNHFKTGHFYFTLKDEKCSVKAVMFRTYASQIGFLPENGTKVIVRGKISLFERDGAFQIYVDTMIPDGIGAMQMAFEQLKQKLDSEGLFLPEHKKMLPSMPNCVGLVTSKTGAAIQDVFNVTNRRYPMAKFLLCSTTVQGESSAQGIANAIKTLDDSGKCDVILVARGGGSREDLWVFNSELIARAAFACKTPIVSAIGHEIDFCILDFVADLRAPTPSAAAEIIMPNMQAESEKTDLIFTNIYKEIQKKLNLWYNNTGEQMQSLSSKSALHSPEKMLSDIWAKKANITNAINEKNKAVQRRTNHHIALCGSLNPYSVLSRGYSIAQKNGHVIKDVVSVNENDDITVHLNNGVLHCAVTKTERGELFGKTKINL